MKEKVVLAYSGGLDTSVIVHWLNSKGFSVIAVCFDVGQKVDDWQRVINTAKTSGAAEALVVDIKHEFVDNFFLPCLQMNALYEGSYLLGTAMARPLIAQKQIEIANSKGAKYVSHGATGKGNDQARFEMSYLILNPNIKIIAPWKMAEFYQNYPGRKELLDYAAKHDIKVKVTKEQPWSSDENLMHISFEAGLLEDPNKKPPPEMFEMTKSPQDAPNKGTVITIDFVKGVPVKLNGKDLNLVEMLTKLNQLGGDNGVGRVDLVESRFIGMKSRGVYETPGGTILMQAHRQIESITLTRDVIELKDSLLSRFSDLVYNGYWFTPQMSLLLDLVKNSQKSVNGQVRLEIYKGNVITLGRSSKTSLYDFDIASMEKNQSNYNPEDANGFIKLNALPYIIKNLNQPQD
ncbi:MAG: argininosuccinate synthase [SAR324 cluster bacterium]|nr:argininosuccinate synthase [SAR324 cluster bacterium]